VTSRMLTVKITRHSLARLLALTHPVLFVWAVVLDRFGLHTASPQDLIRPLVVGALGAILATVVLWQVLRAPLWGSLAASISILLFLGYAIPGGLLLALGCGGWLSCGYVNCKVVRPSPPGVQSSRLTSPRSIPSPCS